jgi:hypothetical protein
MSTPAAIETQGRAVTRSPQRAKAREGCTCSGFLGLQPAPERAHHDRQDRQRRDDDRPDPDRRRDPELADQRDSDHEQAGDGDHHDQAGGDHRSTRRGGRLGGGVARAVSEGDLLPVAPDDQQRVVDAGAEAEHYRDDRRELRQAERLRQRREQDLAGHNAEQRAHDRRRHRSERAEQEGQQDDRNRHSDQLAGRRILLGGEVDQNAARGDVDAVLLRGAGGRLEGLSVLLVEIGGLDVVADVDRGDAPVLGHAPTLTERVLHLLDVLEAADLIERALDGRTILGISDAAVLDAEHERRVRAGERRAVLLEEIERLLRFGPRDREVVGGLPAGAGGRAEQDEDDDRRREAALPVLGKRAGETREKL